MKSVQYYLYILGGEGVRWLKRKLPKRKLKSQKKQRRSSPAGPVYVARACARIMFCYSLGNKKSTGFGTFFRVQACTRADVHRYGYTRIVRGVIRCAGSFIWIWMLFLPQWSKETTRLTSGNRLLSGVALTPAVWFPPVRTKRENTGFVPPCRCGKPAGAVRMGFFSPYG